jgi:hypothetical protein
VTYAKKITLRIIGAYPDSGRATPEYIASMVEAIANLTSEEIDEVMDPRTGIVARSKFLPTIAEVHEIFREKKAMEDAERAKEEAARNRFVYKDGVSWNRLERDDEVPDPRPPAAVRAKQVRDLLGYDPLDPKARRDPPAFKTKPLSEFKSSADCSRQDNGPSQELLDLIARQDSGEEPRWG